MPGEARPGARLYLVMACLGGALAAVGFSKRYLLTLAAGTSDLPAIVHIHGIITFGWVLFVILQAALVAARRTALHRSLGMAGIALATLLVFTATQVAILLLARELKEGGPAPREFVALLLILPLLVTGLFGAAIAAVHRPEVHKRLVLVASFVVLAPALARIIQLLDPSLTRLARNDLSLVASDALILIALVWDARARGRLHPAYLIAGGCVVVTQIAMLLIRSTQPWHAATTWLASLVG